MSDSVSIRAAVPEDAAALLAIYAPYVEHTAITFEYDVPSLSEFRGRIEKTLTRYPYLVAEIDGKPVGYAYAGPLKDRRAYDYCVELSIYVDETCRKHGVGRLLYDGLENCLGEMGITNLYACIGYPDIEDEYLTKNSVGFHEHMGYEIIGSFRKCGYKFKRSYSMVWMEKIIGDHLEDQPAMRPFPEVRGMLGY